jgi:TRAP-type mannitol/chloroaromatic compound transport system permease large subunit
VTIAKLVAQVPGGLDGAMLAVLALSLIFCLFLDALEILLIVVPIATQR